MLNLPEFEVIKKEVNEYYYKFTVVAKDRPYVCTQCLWDEMPIMGDNRKFTIHALVVIKLSISLSIALRGMIK